MSDYNIKLIIETAFVIGQNNKFKREELEALAEAANGEYSETKPKADWILVDFENEPSLMISPKHYDKVMHGHGIAKAIYEQSVEAGVEYASEWEYFCLVLRTLRCLSKCAFLMED